MKKVLKVKEYLLASKGQFIPLEQSITSDGIVVIQKVERIKDGKEFISDIDKPLAHVKWTVGFGVEMNRIVYIEGFCNDYIHVLLSEWTFSDGYIIDSSADPDNDEGLEGFIVEINNLNDSMVNYVLEMGRKKFQENYPNIESPQ